MAAGDSGSGWGDAEVGIVEFRLGGFICGCSHSPHSDVVASHLGDVSQPPAPWEDPMGLLRSTGGMGAEAEPQ